MGQRVRWSWKAVKVQGLSQTSKVSAPQLHRATAALPSSTGCEPWRRRSGCAGMGASDSIAGVWKAILVIARCAPVQSTQSAAGLTQLCDARMSSPKLLQSVKPAPVNFHQVPLRFCKQLCDVLREICTIRS